jgi:TfoX/Sxy family transcriptional regulator of competence genes
MKFTKPSPGLIEEFRAVVLELRGAEPRKMFGYDAFFVNGNLAAGLWQNTCVFKLSKSHTEEFLQLKGARPFAPMKGRVMGGWVEAPEEVSHDPESLREWCERALAHARTLPPKAPKLSQGRTTKATKRKAQNEPRAEGATAAAIAPAKAKRAPAKSKGAPAKSKGAPAKSKGAPAKSKRAPARAKRPRSR